MRKRCALLFATLVVAASAIHAQEGAPSVSSPGAPPPPSPAELSDQLMRACDAGNLDRVKSLLAQGASLDAGGGPYQITPLMGASKHIEITNYLLGLGAKLDSLDTRSNTAIADACYYDQPEVVAALLNAGANPNLANLRGRLPLMYAASHGDDAMVKLLLAHHADINGNSDAGTALYRAVEDDRASTVQLLIDSGADLKLGPNPLLPERRFWSLLGTAANYGHLDVMDILLNHGVSTDDAGVDGTTALIWATGSKQLGAVTKLLAHGADVNRADEKGLTPLLMEMTHYDPAILDQLLQHNADVNLADHDGKTPLMVAVRYAGPDLWKALLQHGAKLEQKDKDGRTALIFISFHLYEPAIEFLVTAGANVNAVDGKDETALTYAGSEGEMSTVEYLKAHGAVRTDIHIVASEKPNPPLAADHAWALAVGAIYPQKTGYNPNVLGYGRTDRQDSRDRLEEDWQVTDRASLLQVLQDLREKGHRAGFLEKGAKLAALTDAQWAVLSPLDPSGETAALKKNYLKWKEKTGLAWDLCRYVNLINLGYSSGYLDEWGAWLLMTPIAAMVHASFSSWQEMSDNFLDGREIWAGHRDPGFEVCSQLLLDPKEANSPWNENPWSAGPPPL